MKLRTLALALALSAVPSVALAGTAVDETHQGRTVRVFTPTDAKTKALVVMLHGCTQTATGFADATQIEALAETEGFVVASIHQLDSAPQACWQWWDPAHQSRGAGEPAAIAATIDELVQQKSLDADRVYVAGLSAGGGMTVIMGATYPDKIAAIGVVAGLEYKAASSLGGVFTVSGSGGPEPNAQGDLAFTEMGPRAHAMPTFVIQGTSDSIVDKVNGDQIAAMWLRVNSRVLGDAAVDKTPATSTETLGYPFTRTVWRTTDKSALVHYLKVEGLGHAWPGGKAGGSYADAKGPDATKELWAFFAPRTKTNPLVLSPDPPPPQNVPPVADPLPSDNNGAPPSASSSSGSSSDSGGGCSASRSGHGGLAGLLVAIGAVLVARRARRSTKA